MFEQHLSDLAAHPTSIGRFLRYTKQLAKEQNLRGFDLFLITIVLIIQTIITVHPPDNTVRYSADFLTKGIASKEDLLAQWDKTDSDLPAIYGKFGIKRQDISNLTSTPNSTITSTTSSNYWFASRSNLTSKKSLRPYTPISVDTDGPTVYFHPLNAWNGKNKQVSYKAFGGRSSTTGQAFWLLDGSGDYVQLGKTIKPSSGKKSTIETQASVINNDQTQQQDLVFQYRNTSSATVGEDLVLSIKRDDTKFLVINDENYAKDSESHYLISLPDMAYTSYSSVIKIPLLIKNDSSLNLCSVISLSSPNSDIQPLGCDKNTLGPSIAPSIHSEVTSTTDNQKFNSKQPLQPNETIEYHLTFYNPSDTTVTTSHKIYIGDILDYSDLDRGHLEAQGGYFNPSSNEIIWNDLPLVAGKELIKSYRVTIKSSLPNTPPTYLSTNNDCSMDLTAGNEISLPIDCPTITNIANVPKLSDKVGLLITVSLFIMSAYFYLRTRLIHKEARLLIRLHKTRSK